jgi:hypothetical protein
LSDHPVDALMFVVDSISRDMLDWAAEEFHSIRHLLDAPDTTTPRDFPILVFANKQVGSCGAREIVWGRRNHTAVWSKCVRKPGAVPSDASNASR